MYLFFKPSFLIVVFFLLGGLSCHPGPKSVLQVVQLKAGGKNLWVEVANKLSTRETGLMFRREMGKDDGMLFVFKEPQQLYFWMKNTYIPLSIAYLDEQGRILNTLEMPPLTENNFPSKGPAKYAIEMNAGWFPSNGIKEGDVVEGVLTAPRADE
jgi:uncharacterized membrane protein (UPF0127 family)